MRILTAELRKTFTLRFFLVLLIAVAANFLLFRHNLSGGYSFYGQEAYVALQKEVITMGEYLGVPEEFTRKKPSDGLTGKTDEEDHNSYIRQYYILYSLDTVCDISQVKEDLPNEPLYWYDDYQLKKIKQNWYRMEVSFKYW